MRNLVRFISLTALAVSALMFGPELGAVSMHPDVVEKLRAEGQLENRVKLLQSARERGAWAGPKEPYRFSLSMGNEQDTMRIVVILVEFTDNRWYDRLADGTADYFEDLLFSDGVLEYGSMKEYFLENSYGKFVVIGEVYGWYLMPAYYADYTNGQMGMGGYPNNSQRLAEDAVRAADPDVDFGLYDNDGDGWVDGLLIVHAGEGHETSDDPNDIHSHQWNMANTQILDGVFMRGYTMMPEENRNTPGDLSTIGVFAHEFGHLVGGLPDLYDTDYSSSGLGDWSMMAGGSWNGNGASPAHFDAWCKEQFGFLDPIVIDSNKVGYEFPAVECCPHVVKLWREGSPAGQYFLVENRQKTGFDVRLPGSGLMIYHVDNSQPNNNNEGRYKVALEQADGLRQLEQGLGGGDMGDPYPGSTNNREFSDRSYPNSRGYANTATQVAVWDPSESDSVMTADLDVFFSRPYFTVDSMSFDDPDGNGNGILDLGETVDVVFSAENHWSEGDDVVATMSLADDRLIPVIELVNLGTIGGQTTFDNSGAPLKFSIPSDMDTIQIDVTITLTSSSNDEEAVLTSRAGIGGPKILIVDDDNGDEDNLERYYTSALDSLWMPYEVWHKDLLGTPVETKMAYPTIIWFTGDERDASLTTSDIEFLKSYLDYGGGLFLSGQDVAEHVTALDSTFLRDYLHCSYGGNISEFQWEAHGQAFTEIGGDSIKLAIREQQDAAGNLTSPDYLIPHDETTVNFIYFPDDSGSACGIELETDYYRAVFFSFGFEAINDFYGHFAGYGTRKIAMSRIVNYLEGRQAVPNRPPSLFSLTHPVDGDSVEGNIQTLVWQTASDPDLLDPVEYTLYVAKSDTAEWEYSFEALADTALTLEDLEYDILYYWKVVASDSHGAETHSVTSSFFLIRDIVPPSFSIKLIANPVIPSLLDIYAYPSEELESLPALKVFWSSGEDSTEMMLGENRATTVYMADYAVEDAGAYTISVCGTDLWENYSCTDKEFSAAPLFADEMTEVESYSGLFKLAVKPESVKRSALLLAFEQPVTSDDQASLDTPADFEPIVSLTIESSVSLDREAVLTVDLAKLGLSGDEVLSLALYHAGETGTVSVPIRYGRVDRTVSALISQFGTYILGRLDGTNGELSEEPRLPSAFALHQNWPNPFNPSTSIPFDLPEPVHVNLVIYNILGQKVTTVVDQHFGSGSHTVSWGGTDDSGRNVSSGIYFYRLRAGDYVDTKRMVLLK